VFGASGTAMHPMIDAIIPRRPWKIGWRACQFLMSRVRTWTRSSGVTGSLCGICAIPSQRLVIGPIQRHRLRRCPEVSHGVASRGRGSGLGTAEVGEGTVLGRVGAVLRRIRVQRGAMTLPPDLPKIAELRVEAARLPLLLDPGIDLFADERARDDARMACRTSSTGGRFRHLVTEEGKRPGPQTRPPTDEPVLALPVRT